MDKLHLATSALVKHSQHTSATLMQFAATVTELEEAETKAIASRALCGDETRSDEKTAESGGGCVGADASRGVTRAATLFASTSARAQRHTRRR